MLAQICRDRNMIFSACGSCLDLKLEKLKEDECNFLICKNREFLPHQIA
jgi:hypothetical protein